MNALEFMKLKGQRKLSMITCYDFTSAAIVAQSKMDAVLVGDSGAMVMAGHKDTLQATTRQMCQFTAAVARGLTGKLLIADMPFLTFRKSVNHGLDTARALLRAGATAVKLEGVRGHEALIERLVVSGIPVMGHLGLTPQSVHTLGGYKVQGRSKDAAQAIFSDAKKLEELGAFSIVLECVPTSLAEQITASVSVPTIGIGAGPSTDGQVLVFQDLLGLNAGGHRPKFVRQFADGFAFVKDALDAYSNAVESGDYPSIKESYL
jgi:3-methyl-2-oxobutanoate hydroxymethyltransferase